MSDMTQFFSRAKANEGIEFPLYLPGTNIKSEHFLRIRGMDSDEFRVAEGIGRRELGELSRMEEPARSLKFLESKRRLIATLICGWSFEQECTLENAMAFLKEAPHIEDAINRVASERSLFFMKGSDSSTGSPDPSSS